MAGEDVGTRRQAAPLLEQNDTEIYTNMPPTSLITKTSFVGVAVENLLSRNKTLQC